MLKINLLVFKQIFSTLKYTLFLPGMFYPYHHHSASLSRLHHYCRSLDKVHSDIYPNWAEQIHHSNVVKSYVIKISIFSKKTHSFYFFYWLLTKHDYILLHSVHSVSNSSLVTVSHQNTIQQSPLV